ncbi:MAG: HD domain-containing protein [Vicinamibacterales bacterium]
MSMLTTELGRTSNARLIWRFGCAETMGLMRKLVRAAGYARPARLDAADFPIPDSELANQATRLVRELSPKFLFNHGVRVFMFADAIGRHNKLKYDREVVYLAAVMHDLGLVSQFNGDGSFEVEGAGVARRFLLEHGLPEGRADLVHEAIALHAAVGKASKMAPEIALVHFGAGMDVVGFRAEDLATDTVRHIVEAYPRHGFKKAFSEVLEDEVRRKPSSHMAGHVRLGFLGKIQSAPFAD